MQLDPKCTRPWCKATLQLLLWRNPKCTDHSHEMGFRPHFSSYSVGRVGPALSDPRMAAQSCPQASLTSWRPMRLRRTSTRAEEAALPELTSPATFGCTTHTSQAAVAKLTSKKKG